MVIALSLILLLFAVLFVSLTSMSNGTNTSTSSGRVTVTFVGILCTLKCVVSLSPRIALAIPSYTACTVYSPAISWFNRYEYSPSLLVNTPVK